MGEMATMNDAKRDYIAELKAENASCELKDRKFEIMLIHASGCCTLAQLAGMFHCGVDTIMTYIEHIYEETGCPSRKSLHQYVVDKGWNGLERFFFSYIPETVQQ